MSTNNNFTAARFLAGVLLGMVLAGAAAGQERPSLAVRSVEGRIEVGTDTSAPYYLQWCAPMGEWANWTENALIEPTLKSVWFRARFEDPEGDPMGWDPPADVPFYAAEAVGEAVGEGEGEDDIRWVSVGAVDEEGAIRVVAARDWMMENVPAAPVASTNPLETVAVPDAGTVRLFWRNRASNRAFVWHLGATAERKGATAVYDLNLSSGWIIAGVGNFGNGALNVVWHNTGSGRTVIWMLEDDGVRASAQVVREEALDVAWRIAAIADVNGDGVDDLLWRNTVNNRLAVWFLNNGGTFDSEIEVVDMTLPREWVVAGLNKIDGDGVPDVLWFNTSTRRVYVWFLNADGTRKDHGEVFESNLSASWEVAGLADIDGDGPADIVWFNRSSRRTYIWFLNADGTRKDHGPVHDVNLAAGWVIAGVQDVDSDGTPDLVWFNTSTRRVYAWFLNADGTRRDHGPVYDLNLSADWRIDAVAVPTATPVF
jgi:hypothetical protein